MNKVAPFAIAALSVVGLAVAQAQSNARIPKTADWANVESIQTEVLPASYQPAVPVAKTVLANMH
nr:hypothetical protein [uncultured Shimia sp.]